MRVSEFQPTFEKSFTTENSMYIAGAIRERMNRTNTDIIGLELVHTIVYTSSKPNDRMYL